MPAVREAEATPAQARATSPTWAFFEPRMRCVFAKDGAAGGSGGTATFWERCIRNGVQTRAGSNPARRLFALDLEIANHEQERHPLSRLRVEPLRLRLLARLPNVLGPAVDEEPIVPEVRRVQKVQRPLPPGKTGRPKSARE